MTPDRAYTEDETGLNTPQAGGREVGGDVGWVVKGLEDSKAKGVSDEALY